MSKIILAAIICLFIGGVFGYFAGRSALFKEKEEMIIEQTVDMQDADIENDLIRVSTPQTNETITSPLEIRGSARGTWFFEGSFPVYLYDADKNLIGHGVAMSEGDSATEGFVPFTATISFDYSDTLTGILVLEKDNPSGLPENDDLIQIPVEF